MADKNRRAIKVNPDGWQIKNDLPILFRRYSHQLTLPEPIQHGDPWKLLHFINVDGKDEATRLVLLCVCASYLIPSIPHPILVLFGIQGSGKSSCFRVIKRIFDPSCIELLSIPQNERERVQQLDHHWLAFYDNVTSMPLRISDSLCRAATGGGFTKRELYSDDEDIIYNFKRCIGLNGINIAAQRGDLLDRCVLIQLQNISGNSRRTEEALLAEFEKEKSVILGGFLDLIVKAKRLLPSISPERLFRMADFTRWGCAFAQALGRAEREFIEAYGAKVKGQIEEAAHSSPVATVLLDYLETSEYKTWEGSPTDLFKKLLEHAKSLQISNRQKNWPKAPNSLVRKLNELAPSLKSLGWEVITSRTGSSRNILIKTVTTVIASPDDKTYESADDNEEEVLNRQTVSKNVETPNEGTIHGDDSDDIFSIPITVLSIDELALKTKEFSKLTTNFGTEPCTVCGTRCHPKYQATFFDGTYRLTCQYCGDLLAERLNQEHATHESVNEVFRVKGAEE
ncbi:MAG: hypothetical protein ACXACB_00055 [Promethearchaeota archaeon]